MYGLGRCSFGQPDVEADGPAAGVLRAPVGRLHDAAAAPRADHEAAIAGQAVRPFRQQPGERARLVVVAAEGTVGRDARRAEEHDRVLDPLLAEAAQRLEVLGQDAQRPGVVAVDEGSVVVGEPPGNVGHLGDWPEQGRDHRSDRARSTAAGTMAADIARSRSRRAASAESRRAVWPDRAMAALTRRRSGV